MKNIFFTLAFSFIAVLTGFAQMTEGHITYSIEASTDDPEMQMAIAMLQGSTMDLYFKEKATRSEMKMGTMMTITTITNEADGNVLMLMGGMMGNNAVRSTMEELEVQKEEAEQPKYEVTLSDETKEIVGYTCKKATLVSEDGAESIFWYTDDIEVSKKGQNYLSEEVPGFPMQFEINNGGLVMTMTVTELDKKLDKKKGSSLFSMDIPEGYTEMSMEDLQMMGM
jgi:GLPGLI family protein